MRRILPALKPIIPYFLIVIWIIFFIATMILGDPFLSVIVILVVPAVLLLSYLFFDPDFFLYAIIFFVPLSVKMDFPGGFSLSFPSEALAVLMLFYMFIHAGSIRIPSRKIFYHPVFVILVVYLVWLLLCSALSFIPLVSFQTYYYPGPLYSGLLFYV